MTPLPLAIGLTGFAQSGKDTTAQVLAEYGYKRASFADILREAVYRLNPWITIGPNERWPKAFRLQEIVDEEGWDEAKKRHPEIRRLLQVMGTEVGRELIHANVWVDALLDSLEPGERYVFTDVRFPNEAIGIHQYFDHDVEIWRVVRPGVQAVNDHSSEIPLDEKLIDYVLVNNGSSLSELQATVAHHLDPFLW
jgi:hypothetical protein